MKISDLKSHDQVHHERYASDPAYAAEVGRLTLADAGSMAVVKYRSDGSLSRAHFAQTMGWTQPQVDRIERDDAISSLQTLQRLAGAGI